MVGGPDVGRDVPDGLDHRPDLRSRAASRISGVVGATEVTRQSIEFDTRQALFVLGIISLSLAVINLFPFLPLDGGHIFWSLVERCAASRSRSGSWSAPP